MSAILKTAGVTDRLKRPKGGRGTRRLFFFTPEQASRLLEAAEAIDAEFALFLGFLLYTGCRLSEALAADLAKMNLAEAWIYLTHTKSGELRLAHLPPVLVAALACHPRGVGRAGKLFRFGKNGRLYTWLEKAAKHADLAIPDRVAFPMPSGTHGAHGCAATAAWTQAVWLRLGRGDHGKPQQFTSTPYKRRRHVKPMRFRSCGKGRGKWR